jgi:hypothetical protein
MASSTTNITMRLENALVECIDKSAERAGLTRSAYIVSWLPDAYDGRDRVERPRIADAGQRPPGRARRS